MAKNFDVKSLPSDDGKLSRSYKPDNIGNISVPIMVVETPKGQRVRPEDVRAARKADSLSKVRNVNTAKAASLKAYDASRQDPLTQARQLKAAIAHNLRRVASLTQRGELDRATIVCCIIAKQHGTALGLADKIASQMQQEADTAKEVSRKAKLTVAVKVKRYARWSDK